MTGRVSKIKGSARAAGHYPAPALEPQGVLELTDSEDDIIELTDSDDVLELTDSEDPVDLRASITLKVSLPARLKGSIYDSIIEP